MQAIILAAGMGKRLGEYTKDNTKCMLPVGGQCLIDRCLTILAKYNLSRVIIVTGYKGQALKDHVGHRYSDRLSIEYIDNPVYDKTNNIYSLSLAKDKMTEDDTILLESDIIFEDRIIDALINAPHPNVALVAHWERWMDGTVVRIDSDSNIVSFIPKEIFDYDDIDNYYKTVNIYKFSKDFSAHRYIPFLNAYCQAWGNNAYYEQVLRVLTFLDDTDLKALPIGDMKWYEIDDAQDLDIAETLFAADEELLHKYHQRYGGFWRFPQLTDFCYLVNPFFPPQAMIDELKSSFDPLLTQYPSGMGVNTLLAAKYFGIRQELIVVGNGAAELIKSVMEHQTGKTGIIYPTFEEYPNRKNPQDIVPFLSARPDYQYGIEDLQQFYEDKDISTLLLINPDNPSGNFIPVSDVLLLAQWCQARCIRLIVDESFVDFSENHTQNSLLHNDILHRYPSMAVVKSISKSYGVPGLRLGILASSDTQLIGAVKKDLSIWNINSFAEYYMQIFGKYERDYLRACDQFIAERNRFLHQMAAIPFLRVIPSQANYFMIQLDTSITPRELSILLLKRYNILIKDCDSKHGLEHQRYVRIAVRSREDNDRLIAALHEIALQLK